MKRKDVEELENYVSDIADKISERFGLKFNYKLEKTSDEIILKDGEMALSFYAEVERKK